MWVLAADKRHLFETKGFLLLESNARGVQEYQITAGTGPNTSMVVARYGSKEEACQKFRELVDAIRKGEQLYEF